MNVVTKAIPAGMLNVRANNIHVWWNFNMIWRVLWHRLELPDDWRADWIA